MLSASTTYGIASRSDPFTGKVTKGYLDAAGTANGAGIGNPNAEFSPDVTALAMDADAGRVVWGFRAGEVGVTVLGRQGTNPRGAVKSLRFSPRGAHAGSVTHISVPFGSGRGGANGPQRSSEKLQRHVALLGEAAATFVTAGQDGTVRLWSPKRTLPIWIASTAAAEASKSSAQTSAPPTRSTRLADAITRVDYDPSSGTVAAGTSSGELVIWTGIDISGLVNLPAAIQDEGSLFATEPSMPLDEARESLRQTLDSIRVVRIQPPPALDGILAPQVAELVIDAPVVSNLPNSAARTLTSKFSLLVHYATEKVFVRHSITVPPKKSASATVNGDGVGQIDEDGDKPQVSSTIFGGEGLAEITAIRPDFNVASGQSALSASSTIPPSPVTTSSMSPTSEAVPDDGDRPPPPLVLGPSPWLSRDPATSLYAERKYVVAGTKSGGVLVWLWDSDGVALDEEEQTRWQGRPRNALHRGDRQVKPALVLGGHHAAITALEITNLLVLAGSLDGTVKAFCPLTGALLRTFNDRTATRHPARLLAAGALSEDEAQRWTVKQIIASSDSVVAAIGPNVLAWRCDPANKKQPRKANAGKPARPGAVRGDPKFQLAADLKRDLRESQALLQAEREDQQASYARIRYATGPAELGGLSEQEALEYAMMLSRDEEEARRVGFKDKGAERSSHGGGFARRLGKAHHDDEDADLQEALRQIELAESGPSSRIPSSRQSIASSDAAISSDEREQFDEFFDEAAILFEASSPSPSPSPRASPSLQGLTSPSSSRAWSLVNSAAVSGSASPVSNADRWFPNSKVRTVAVPRAARFASASASASPRSEATTANVPELGSPHDYPSLSPSSRSPGTGSAWPRGSAPNSLSAQSQSRSPGGWSAASASPTGAWALPPTGTGLAARRPSGAWASASPRVLNPAGATASPSSLLSHALASNSTGSSTGGGTSSVTGNGNGGAPAAQGSSRSALSRSLNLNMYDDGMDDDMRFAIELSLAEERSWMQNGAGR